MEIESWKPTRQIDINGDIKLTDFSGSGKDIPIGSSLTETEKIIIDNIGVAQKHRDDKHQVIDIKSLIHILTKEE